MLVCFCEQQPWTVGVEHLEIEPSTSRVEIMPIPLREVHLGFYTFFLVLVDYDIRSKGPN